MPRMLRRTYDGDMKTYCILRMAEVSTWSYRVDDCSKCCIRSVTGFWYESLAINPSSQRERERERMREIERVRDSMSSATL